MKAQTNLTERDIHEFLPAAIEIERSPAPRFGRAILWSIIVLFVIAVTWACIGKVDIVAVATGKVIPSERVKQIQPLETAIIAAIHVQEGDHVNVGDPLITLDPTVTEADVRRLQKEWREAYAQLQRITAFAAWLQRGQKGIPQMAPNSEIDQAQRDTQNTLLQQEGAEFLAKLNALKQEAERLNFERKMTQAEIQKQQRLLPVMSERVGALEKLYEQQYVAKIQYLELQQQLIEVEQNLAVQQARLQTLDASIKANSAQQLAMQHEQLKNILTQQQQLDVQAATLWEEKTKAEQRARQYKLTAPLAGSIQQLAMHTIGGVVTPAQILMEIVPEDSQLEVEAFVLNQDIGFVKSGQSAEIKIETFNFTKYGLIDAELVNLSEDAIQDENLGLIYRGIFKLKAERLLVEDKWIRLSPGMNVTAEIKIGHRRLVEYFLSPLLRYKHNSVRER